MRLANEVILKCGDILEASTNAEPAKSLGRRMREQVIGLRWTPEAIAAYEAALTALAVARKEFAEYARRHTGRVRSPERPSRRRSP